MVAWILVIVVVGIVLELVEEICEKRSKIPTCSWGMQSKTHKVLALKGGDVVDEAVLRT